MPLLQQPAVQNKIRVRVKSTGQIGSIPSANFSPGVFERLEEAPFPERGFELQDILPFAGGIAGGALGTLGGPVGTALGAAAGAGLGRLAERAIRTKTEEREPPVTLGGALGAAGKEALIAGAIPPAFRGAKALARPALRLLGKGAAFAGEAAFGPAVTRTTAPLIFKHPKLALEMRKPGALGKLIASGKSLTKKADVKTSTDYETAFNAAVKVRPNAKVDLVSVRNEIKEAFAEGGFIKRGKIDVRALPISDPEIRGLTHALGKIFLKTQRGIVRSIPATTANNIKRQIDQLYRTGPDAQNYNRILTRVRGALKLELDRSLGPKFQEANSLYHSRIDDVRFLKKNFLEEGGRRAELVIRKLTPRFRQQLTPEDENFLNNLLGRAETLAGTKGQLRKELELYAATAIQREPLKGLVGQPFVGASMLGGRGFIKATRGLGRAAEALKRTPRGLKKNETFGIKLEPEVPELRKLSPFEHRIASLAAKKLFENEGVSINRKGRLVRVFEDAGFMVAPSKLTERKLDFSVPRKATSQQIQEMIGKANSAFLNLLKSRPPLKGNEHAGGWFDKKRIPTLDISIKVKTAAKARAIGKKSEGGPQEFFFDIKRGKDIPVNQ